ncbi:hypothetical protein MXD62_26600, partial [Frankia sp. Mgl5]|uniref:hypothetical protein n=1 Tax=Frankia sp. Mgl5 TaxID=2933793 RepID=UPI00200BF10C
MHADGLQAQLAARFRQLTDERGLTGVQLEKLTTYSRNNVSWRRCCVTGKLGMPAAGAAAGQTAAASS